MKGLCKKTGAKLLVFDTTISSHVIKVSIRCNTFKYWNFINYVFTWLKSKVSRTSRAIGKSWCLIHRVDSRKWRLYLCYNEASFRERAYEFLLFVNNIKDDRPRSIYFNQQIHPEPFRYKFLITWTLPPIVEDNQSAGLLCSGTAETYHST